METLLLTRNDIKELYDPDSDEYLTLLTVEAKLEELKNKGILGKDDIEVLDQVLQGGSYSSLEDELNLHRVTIAKKFKGACYKISYALGGEFTDEGFIQKVVKENNLTAEQSQLLREYIQGNLRHKLRRSVDE